MAPITLPIPRFTSQYRAGDLAQGRLEAVLKDLKRYRRVSYPTLVHSAFGSPPETSHIRQKLIDDGVLRVSQDGVSQWSDFIVKPSKTAATEGVVFDPLITIVSKIFSEIPNCQFECSANPHVRLLSERGNTSRPDAYVRCSGPGKTHWFDIVIPFEFKKTKNPSGTQDNEWKMIWSLHNIMREDPLRRFTFGITVEDTEMRLWYHSRALLTVSEPVDFTTAIDDVVSLFYSVGSKTKVELGWDPTVERIIVKGEIQYMFKIDNQCFVTTRALATLGADVMVGRGTRVYEAQDEHHNVVAIKDSWRDEDREPEGKILEMIFKDIRVKFGEKEAKAAERYFVRVRAYEDVRVSGETDRTLNPGEDGDWVDIDDEHILSEIRHSSSIRHPPFEVVRRAPRQSNKIPCRVHARTVFCDVGVTLMDVTRLADSFSCLSDSGRALYYIHKAGWVHRDFSVANVLWVEESDGWVGKLSDFEFAKKVDSEISHDVRTGTMHFMAVEVANQTYQFAPEDTEERSSPSFHMNPLHDLESQWWTATWILFYHTDANSPTQVLDQQQQSYDKAFPHTFNTGDRFMFFRFRNVLLQASATLSESYRDRGECVLNLARSLHEFYRKAEKSYPDVSVEDDLLEEAHKATSRCYSAVTKSLRVLQTDVTLQPLRIFRGRKKRLSGNLDDSLLFATKKKAKRAMDNKRTDVHKLSKLMIT